MRGVLSWKIRWSIGHSVKINGGAANVHFAKPLDQRKIDHLPPLLSLKTQCG
jgi:hypothetical protein